MPNNVNWSECRCAQYEFSIRLNASRERVWHALTRQIGSWWLPHFHMLGGDSVVELEPLAGGRLFEAHGDQQLLWYTVISIDPGKSMELAGALSAKYGGPATTMLALELSTSDDGQTVLRLSDSLYGRVTDGMINSLHSGWQELFVDGLQTFVNNSESREDRH